MLNFMSFGENIGIDLGTATVLVYIKGQGIVIREPSVVAIDKDSNTILAVGEEARRMLGRTPGNIVAIRPLREGVISNYDVTEKMLQYFIEKAMELLQDGRKAIFLLKIQFLETELRAKLFKQYGLKHVIVNSSRVCCAKNGNFDLYFRKKGNRYTGGTQCYCWFGFEKGYVGESTIDWIVEGGETK